MLEAQPLAILCVSSYEKGQEFIRTCKAAGCRVLLLTVEKLRHADWPFESIDEVFTMPEELPLQDLIYAVSYAARSQSIDRIVALDEFDMENVSALREHLRLPGMGLSAIRHFRDKLTMRAQANQAGILVPDFVHVLNYDNLREFMSRVPGPWLLKPRSQASGIGMKKIYSQQELWPWLDQLGDRQSFYLLEKFVPGAIYHVDSVVSERRIVFAEAHVYGTPPLDTSHHGGVFTTRTLPREGQETKALLEINRHLFEGLGLVRGVTHAEFLQAHADGRFYFIEVAARVGGAYISNVIEAATGINLWREWARLEVGAGNQPYQLPSARGDYAGVILSLARQEHPDTSAYTDPEIIYRVRKYHHAGFILKSHSHERIQQLLDSYARRFQADFVATQPVPDKPSS
ncbi:MAG: ATPase [Acidobacteria bacterium]|nr:MAG: ATPase [Acidobacteriota bacterium]PYU61997.1 MAG: ATPase [Acidobacteriota bacterium]PYU72705.1 MAG: ATPase [Acidobacteriota bacterium]